MVSTEKGREFAGITSDDITGKAGQWTVIFWWPKDHTFVCPTEIAAFNRAVGDLKDRNTQLMGPVRTAISFTWHGRDHADL